MAVDPKQHLHMLIDRLNDDEARDLSAVLDPDVTVLPLTADDLLLAVPIMPADESADDLIEAVRHWRREGGDA